jgi:hypothetical protein
VGKIARGQAPGRKLLSAVSRQLGVNADWLLNGTGRPFLADLPGPIALTTVMLPGSPADHCNLIAKWIETPRPVASTQYWLQLDRHQPILRDARNGFLVGDALLMETARQRFPDKEYFEEKLCIGRVDGYDRLKLGSVSYWEDDDGVSGLQFETFESLPERKAEVKQDIYTRLPDGSVVHRERSLKLKPRKARKPEPVYKLNPIPYTSIVAVWLGILRRFSVTEL